MVSISDFSNKNNNGGGNSAGNGVPFYANMPNTAMSIPTDDDLPQGIIDLNEKAKSGKLSTVLFRDEETKSLLETISRKKKPNPLLVGDAGTGKTQIVESLALDIYQQKQDVIDALGPDTKIYELRLADLMAGTSYRGQLEENVRQIIAFAEDPNVVLFVDEIHKLTDGSYSDIAQQLKPALSRSDMRVIGATTTQEVNQLMDDPAIIRRFSRINIPELTIPQTKVILEMLLPSYEAFHDVILPPQSKDDLLDKVIKYSEQYKAIGNHRPDTAITLLDHSMAKAKLRHIARGSQSSIRYVTEGDIKKSAIQDFQTKPVTDSTADDLEKHLEQNIIGQEKVKAQLVDMIRRKALAIKQQNKPNTIMLAGPSGVGKTQIAKELAKVLFGSSDSMIRIDMQEFSEAHTLSRITGSSDGFVGSNSNRPLPLQPLNTNPFQIVLLDEIEKAHRDVQRFFMRAFDEGKVTLARKNEVIDTSKAIFILTTNAGAVDMAKPQLGFGRDVKPQLSKTEVSEILSHHFDREFLARIQHKLTCEPISKAEYKQILAIKYNQIIEEAKENTDFRFTPDRLDIHNPDDLKYLDAIADETYNSYENGRPAERVMESYIENKILDNQQLAVIPMF